MINISNDLKKLKIGKVIENADLKKFNTFKVGDTALAVVYPDDIDSLIKLLKYLKNKKLKYKVLGNGSNVIFDNKYDGVIIKLTNFNTLKVNDIVFKVGAGYNLTRLALHTASLGFTGLEFAVGIPGTLGGAVFMNAGAYKSDMGYIVSEIKVLTDKYEIKTIYNKDLNFHYRTSVLQNLKDHICLEATIILKHGDLKTIMEVIEDRKKRRLMTQPLEYPSAGSVFRNPEGDFAGRLIELNGWKGKGVGGAYVSEKHANFIVNTGNATGNDIKKLILKIQKDIEKKHNITLKIEQEFIE